MKVTSTTHWIETPGFAPDDPHSYIALARRVAIAAALILYGGALFGLGFFVGWAVWGQ